MRPKLAPSPVAEIAVPASSWCSHPPEERQHLFAPDLRIRPDRMLCGLCGELLFLPQPPRAA